MKTTLQLFGTILTALLIITACSSSTSPNINEGERIGTWLVFDAKADWVGTNIKPKSKMYSLHSENDTTYYEQPDSLSMSLFQPSGWESNAAAFTLVDSTYNPDDIYIRLHNPLSETPGMGIAKKGIDHVEYSTSALTVNCDSTYTGNEHLIITYYEKEEDLGRGEVKKVYKINTTGVINATKTLAECPGN